MSGPGIVIAGSGFAGICMAIKLKQAGYHDVVILEKAGELGGTWRDNTYPGRACGVPSHVYSYSFALNPSWTRMFSPRGEIHRHLRECAAKNGVTPVAFPPAVRRLLRLPARAPGFAVHPRLMKAHRSRRCATRARRRGRTACRPTSASSPPGSPTCSSCSASTPGSGTTRSSSRREPDDLAGLHLRVLGAYEEGETRRLPAHPLSQRRAETTIALPPPRLAGSATAWMRSRPRNSSAVAAPISGFGSNACPIDSSSA